MASKNPKRKLPLGITKPLGVATRLATARATENEIAQQVISEVQPLITSGSYDAAMAALADALVDMRPGVPIINNLPDVFIRIGEKRIACSFTGKYNKDRVYAAQGGSRPSGASWEFIGKDASGRTCLGLELNSLAMNLAELCSRYYSENGIKDIEAILQTVEKADAGTFRHDKNALKKIVGETYFAEFNSLISNYTDVYHAAFDVFGSAMFEDDIKDILRTIKENHPTPTNDPVNTRPNRSQPRVRRKKPDIE